MSEYERHILRERKEWVRNLRPSFRHPRIHKNILCPPHFVLQHEWICIKGDHSSVYSFYRPYYDMFVGYIYVDTIEEHKRFYETLHDIRLTHSFITDHL